MEKKKKKKVKTKKTRLSLSLFFKFKTHPCRLAVQNHHPGDLPGNVELQEEALERRCSQEAGAAPTWIHSFFFRFVPLVRSFFFSFSRFAAGALFACFVLLAAHVERDIDLFSSLSCGNWARERRGDDEGNGALDQWSSERKRKK